MTQAELTVANRYLRLKIGTDILQKKSPVGRIHWNRRSQLYYLTANLAINKQIPLALTLQQAVRALMGNCFTVVYRGVFLLLTTQKPLVFQP
ncbi:MAG: hypothetical protein EAY75_11760 [Bacteroidetes bacterium]|nr:MAG: hypothetical protein EAY75_11760 [Bacteroidota bacterium]